MSNVTSLKRKPRLRIVQSDEPNERLFGSPEFIARTRRPDLPSPIRFEPTPKGADDIII